MVNKITPVSCISDFKGKNKEFKRYIEWSNKSENIYKNFDEILQDAKNKLNGVYNK